MPSNDVQIDNNLDVILVPTVSISPSGIRLGYGHGFYDKFFDTFFKGGLQRDGQIGGRGEGVLGHRSDARLDLDPEPGRGGSLVCGRAEALPFRDDSFRAVISNHSLTEMQTASREANSLAFTLHARLRRKPLS